MLLPLRPVRNWIRVGSITNQSRRRFFVPQRLQAGQSDDEFFGNRNGHVVRDRFAIKLVGINSEIDARLRPRYLTGCEEYGRASARAANDVRWRRNEKMRRQMLTERLS